MVRALRLPSALRCAVLSSCVALGSMLGWACSSPWPEQDPTSTDAGVVPFGVRVDPDSPLDAVPPVVRFAVPLAGAAGESLALFQGALSEYHLGRIRKNDLPATLLERSVVASVWNDVSGDRVLAPTVPLTRGEAYSLAAPGVGLVAQVHVMLEPPPVADRVWPPHDSASAGNLAVYCAAAPHGSLAAVPDVASFAPSGALARVSVGVLPLNVAGDRCFTFSLSSGATGDVMPPPALAGVPLDPTPLELGTQPAPGKLDCAPEEAAFGPGCARILDDRVVVRAPDAPTLWTLRADGREWLERVEPSARLVLSGLIPEQPYVFEVAVLDVAGRTFESVEHVVMGRARPHVVINEVLANALGPEPAQEWVELVNDGSVAVDLAGWELADVGGLAVLPAHVLRPGEFALVANETYEPSLGLDVAPAANTPILRVTKLGKGGLANAGEPLELRAPGGAISSRFPARPASKAGFSVARRFPHSLDDDGAEFAVHPDPGASPGLPNAL